MDEGLGQESAHAYVSTQKLEEDMKRVDEEKGERWFDIGDPSRVAEAVQTSLMSLLGEERSLVTIVGPSSDAFVHSAEGKYLFETLCKKVEATREELRIILIRNRQLPNLSCLNRDEGERRTVYFAGPLSFHRVDSPNSRKHPGGHASPVFTGSYVELGIISMIRAIDPESSFVVWIESNMNGSEIQSLLPEEKSVLISPTETHLSPPVSRFSIYAED